MGFITKEAGALIANGAVFNANLAHSGSDGQAHTKLSGKGNGVAGNTHVDTQPSKVWCGTNRGDLSLGMITKEAGALMANGAVFNASLAHLGSDGQTHAKISGKSNAVVVHTHVDTQPS